MLTSDFKEFVALFNSNRVDYLVVGGCALAAYGHPRYTGDRDFWIGTDPQNAEKVVLAQSAPQAVTKIWLMSALSGLLALMV